MLSSKLIQMIEGHWEQITVRIIQQQRRDARLFEVARLPEAELRERAQAVLKNLGHWLVVCKEEDIARYYEPLGRRRFEEDIPLYELVHSLHIIKEKMIDFVRDQGIAQTPVDLYAEEELEHSVDRFFDSAVYHVVRGYELAMREGAHLPLTAARAGR